MLTRRLGDERGIALVMAIGIMFVLAIALTSIVQYTSANSGSASRQNADQQAHSIAEAGLNNALAVLHEYYATEPVFPGDACVLRGCATQTPFTSTYDGREVSWWGRLMNTPALGFFWEIRSTGSVPNPTGPGAAPVTRTVFARVPIVLPNIQEVEEEMLNWIYSASDTVITNSVAINSPFWAGGNLTFENTARINAHVHVAGNLTFKGGPGGSNPTNVSGGPLYVGGLLWLDHSQAQVGTTSAPLEQADLIGGCKFRANPTQDPCVAGGTSKVYATIGQTVQPDPATRPVRNQESWDFWYAYASPGPLHPCEVGSVPGQFDNDGALNRSVSTIFNLTPTTPYSCRTRDGELTWEPGLSPPRLTIRGTIFIDGSAKVEVPGGVGTVQYRGQGSLWLSGAFLIKNSRLCAEIAAGECATSPGAWDPNEHAFVVNADGSGVGGNDSPTPGYGIEVKSSHFQGVLWAHNSIQAVTSGTVVHGPIISTGGRVELSQSGGSNFPSILFAPVGAPGLPPPPAQLLETVDYSG